MKAISKFNIIFLVFIFSIVFPCLLNAQTIKDSIYVEYSFFGNSYFIGEQKISKSEIGSILLNNPSTEKLVISSKQKKGLGYMVLTVGLLATTYILYDVGMSAHYYGTAPFDPNSGQSIVNFALALGIDVLGIFLISGSNFNFNKAIEKYNKDNLISSNRLRINCSANRIGLTLHLK